MIIGSDLTDADYRDLAERAIDRMAADAAGLRHVDSSFTGKELIGAKGAGDYAGIAIPVYQPGHGDDAVAWILRRRNPDIDAKSGKALRKYLTAPGERNRIYFPKQVTAEQLMDPSIPIVWVEGAFKVLALWSLACAHPVKGKIHFLPLGLSGVYNYRGTVGKTINEHGERVSVKDMLPDFDRLVLAGRDNIIAYDADATRKVDVRKARWLYSALLRERGANVGILDWPEKDGKGPDDWLRKMGPEIVLAAIAKVDFNTATGWKAKLLCTDTGKPKGLIENVCIALEGMPEFAGLALDEFAGRVRRPASVPWTATKDGEWTDTDTLQLVRLLQRYHIEAGKDVVSDGVDVVASEHHFHPVREYLDSLEWDGDPRVDAWLTTYLGVRPDHYTSAAGRCWLISAAARIYQPGCKVDVALLFIGEQGQKKSTACRILGEPWFSDNLPDLSASEKDAQSHLIGHWIVELQELAALNKAGLTQVKSYMSRNEDIYRPSYGRRTVHQLRQTAFLATTNEAEPLKDTSGNRRFWPVEVGFIDIGLLRADKDQLWAEAVALYRAGVVWWFENGLLIEAARQEQAERVDVHVWLERIKIWSQGRTAMTVTEILQECIRKEAAHQTHADKVAVVRCLQAMGCRLTWRRVQGVKMRVYLAPEEEE